MYPLSTTYLQIYSCLSKYMNHFPTLFLYSHLALRHLVNTRLPVSRTTEMVHSDAAVQKASKENIAKKVNSWHGFVNNIHPTALNTIILK